MSRRPHRTGTARAAALATAAITLALALTGCGSSSKTSSLPAGPTVATTSGDLRGITTTDAEEFLGIRYAKAPVGPLRWTLPQAPPRPSGTVDATRAGGACPQTTATPGAKASADEDCLFLNVTLPRDAGPGARLPVMVWWHGGGYTTGSGSAYDAQQLADRGHVMVVTANYRLGVFGYLGLPGLPGSGDFGFADQIAALRWARTNAAAFGGDPGNVTVFGQSAGAMSTCAFLTTPEARGLIERAAVQSGSCRLDWPDGTLVPGDPSQTPYTSLATDQQDGTAAAASLGCQGPGTLACLRAKPVASLLKVDEEFADHLTYGTDLLPENPATALAEGHVDPIPVISGGTQEEERAFATGALEAEPKFATPATYPQLITTAFGATQAPAIEARYPLSAYPSAGMAWATVVGDASWSCPTLTGNQQLSAHTTIYPYEFADPSAPNVNGVTAPGMTTGPTHATDLPYLFHLGGSQLLHTPAQQQLQTQMIAAWTSFARTGTPAFPGVTWSPGSTTSTTALQLVPGAVKQVNVSAEHQCSFWSTLHY